VTVLTSLQYLGALNVLVCFEHTPGEPEGKRESPSDGPATPDSVIVTGVMLQGEEIDASLFAPALLEKWENLILAEMRQ